MSAVVQSVSGFLGSPWVILSIAAGLVIVFLSLAIIAWQKTRTLEKTVSRLREHGQRRSNMLLTEREKVMCLEDEIKTMELEYAFLQSAKQDLEVQSTLMQAKLDEQALCENTDTSLSSESEHHEEEEPEATFEIEMEYLRKQAEENLMSARVAEEALAAERTESANLRQNVTELSTQLSDLVLRVNSLKDLQCLQKERIVELEEKALETERDQAALQEEKMKLQKLCTTLEEKRQVLQNQVQERDLAGQQRLAGLQEIRFDEKLENSLKKQVVAFGNERALQLQRRESLSMTRMSEVSAKVAESSEEPMEKMLSSCLIIQQINPQRRCAGVVRKTPQRIYVTDKSTQVDSEDQLERYWCEAALVGERIKVEEQEERIRAAEEDNKALKVEKCNLEIQAKSVLGKLDKMSEVCQQKDQALQQKAAQVDFERREKERKVKDVLKMHKEKLQAIEEQHQESERAYKAEVAFHQKKAQEHRVVAAEAQQALQLQTRKVASLTQKLSAFSAKVPRSPEPLDTISSCLSVQQIKPLRRDDAVSKKTTESISTNDGSTQVESVDQLERRLSEAALVAGRIEVEQQEERIRAAEEDNKALKAEKLNLEIQVKSVLGKLDKMSEVCQQKDQALQQKAAQVDFERREKERKVKDVLKMHKEKLQAIEEQHQKSATSYKAEIASLEKTRDKLMKTCTLLRGQTGPQKQMTAAAKPSNAAAKQQNDQQEALQLEQRKCQRLEETLQCLEQDRDALRTEVSQLEEQAAANQSELHTWRSLCQEKEEDLLTSTIKMEAAEEVMQFLADKINVFEDVLETSQRFFQAELEASEQDQDAERTRFIAEMLQLMENASTIPDLSQTTVEHRSSSSSEEPPYQSAAEDVSHPGQTEVLPPESIASSSEAETASSSDPESSSSSPKTRAASARPRRTKKQQRH